MNKRLKQIRDAEGLTMREFSDRLGMTHSAISLLENGKRNLSSQFISSVCREFNVNEDWLLTGSGEMKKPGKKDIAAAISVELYGLDETSFKYRLLAALAKATPEQLDVIEKLVDEIAKGGE